MKTPSELTRQECIERLTAEGFIPANWALTSFDTVELHVLREYVEALDNEQD